jgi:hypothetical protein
MSKAIRIGLLVGCYAICIYVSYKTGEAIGDAIGEIIMK